MKLREMNTSKNQNILDQSELMKVLAHDLGNYFNAIVGLGDLALHSPCNTKEFLEPMVRTAQTGLDFMDMITKFCILDHQKLTLQEVDLVYAINESQAMLSHRFKNKKIALEFDSSRSIWVWAEANSLVNSVINNLLINAIKFSYPGSTVQCTLEVENSYIVLTIRDDGIGMAQIMIDKLFEMNRKIHRPGTNGEPGSGFGMSLVKKFMDAYGGWIKVQSTPDLHNGKKHGTTITLYFKQS